MLVHDKKVIALGSMGDVPSVVVHRGMGGVVVLSINDADADDSADATPLVTGIASRSQAIALARAILDAAGVKGTPMAQGATSYTFEK